MRGGSDWERKQKEEVESPFGKGWEGELGMEEVQGDTGHQQAPGSPSAPLQAPGSGILLWWGHLDSCIFPIPCSMTQH